jgi:hypothetical protein
MTRSAGSKRQQRVPKADNLADHANELLILLKFNEMAKKKAPAPPSDKVLDELQRRAVDQFIAYRGRLGKVPD